MMNKIILAGALIAAMVSCNQSQQASDRITQIEQAINAYNKTLANQPSSRAFGSSVRLRNEQGHGRSTQNVA